MTRFLTSHPTAANLLMLVFLSLGLTALPSLQRASFPDMPIVKVEVSIAYPGASTQEVEEAICEKMEEAAETVTDTIKVSCVAREGFSQTIYEMRQESDLDRFFNDIRTEIEAIDDFPEQIEEPVMKRIGITIPVTSVAIYGPISQPDLKVYAEQIKTRMQALPGVTQVEIAGFADRQIRIEIGATTLRQFGLSTADIANRIARQSIEMPSGTIETTDADILIKFNDERRNTREFENLIVVSSLTGAEIRLGDIAKIEDTFELEEEKIIFNGYPAALLTIFRTQADDTLNVIDTVTAFVNAEQERAPENASIELTQDQSSLVRDRLNLLVKNGGFGLILVLITLWIFFGIRYSFWVAMGLPVSFGGSLFLMTLFGVTLNLISMVGLLIAVGVLMDDGIVIAENIAAHWARGKKPLDAAVDGAREVMPSVFSSFATTIMIFGPLMFITGDLGAILKALPIVLVMTVSVSLIEAFIILPSHLNHSLSNADKVSKLQRALNAIGRTLVAWLGQPLLGWLPEARRAQCLSFLQACQNMRPTFRTWFEAKRDEVMMPLVERAIQWRYLTLGSVLAFLVFSLSILGLGILKFEAFPDLDGDTVAARILLPQGTPLERTENIVNQVIEAATPIDVRETPHQPGGQKLIQGIMIRYNQNTMASEVGPHVATVSIDLLSAEERTVTLDDFRNEWRSNMADIPDVLNISFGDFEIGPEGLAIDMELSGTDLAELQAASLELQNWVASYAGAEDVMSDMRPGKPEMEIRLREGALALGLDSRMIANQLRAAFYGTTASEIQVGSESFEIDVRLSPEDRNSFDDLEYFTITTPTGAQVPLGTVAILEENRGFARIRRVNGLRTVTIKGSVDQSIGNSSEIVNDTINRFIPELLERYPTVQFQVEGQTAEAAETGSSILRGFSLGLFGVFILLSIQFRSYVEPLIVMMIIPTALIGVVWGHLLLGLNLSMPSIIGFVSLGGIVVNNSILMVTFIKIKGREGYSIHDAAVEAARMRFRAMTLTSLTTLMGMLPILVETSLQAMILKPLIASLAFGILTASILVLFLVPATYLIIEDLGYARFRRHKTDPNQEIAIG